MLHPPLLGALRVLLLRRAGLRTGALVHDALHGGRSLLHRRQVSNARVRLRVVGSLRRMIAVVSMALLLLGATHLVGAALVFSPSGILHAPLLKASGLRGVATVRIVAGRGGRAAMTNVFHARPSFLG